jgi:translation initiation factor 2 alpha subunit (eIF-2alpha)
MAKKKKSVKRQKKLITLEGVKPETINNIVTKVTEATTLADSVKPKDLMSLVNWLAVGEEMVKEAVSGVKDIKKAVLKSDAKTSARASVYVATTPLLKCKVKASDINAVFNQHRKRLANITSLMESLGIKCKADKSKGGAK